MKYSLANYILSVTSNDSVLQQIGPVSIGGEGKHVGSISLNRKDDMFSTDSFATGGYVHNKNLSRVGTANVQLSQLSDAVTKFILLAETFLTGDYDGFTLTLSTNDGREIATCVDCYIVKVPEQTYESSAGNQTWTFTCGEINYNTQS